MTTRDARLKELKDRASERLSFCSDKHFKDLPPLEISKLHHELETYQIELELQNEDLKEAEKTASLLRDKYSDLYDFAPVGYLTLDKDGSIVESNLTLSKMLGIPRNDYINQPLSKFISRSHIELYSRMIHTVRVNYEKERCELCIISKVKKPYWVQLDMVIREKPVNDSWQIDITLTDITKLKESELEQLNLKDELSQSHKMEAIGQLTGGVAHDFNNILGIIMGFAELAQKHSEENNDEKKSEYLEHIISAGQRASKIVNKLLTFNRYSSADEKPITLQSIIHDDTRILSSTLPSSIKINISVDDNLPPVAMNLADWNQLLINLFVNARDAMKGKGVISAELKWARSLNLKCASCKKSVKGDWIEFSLADDGKGISSESLDRIFDPFYTTKEFGKGTGLGLSVIHGIVHNHSGHILVETTPNKGATFRILFPPCRAVPEMITEEQAAINVPQGNHEKIMVIDDEPSMTKLVEDVLTKSNYDAATFNSSLEALDRFKEDPNKFDLIITDQTMPEMNGITLIKEIHKFRPNIPIILMTGYSENFYAEDADELGAKYMKKPVDIVHLLQVVSNLIRSQQSLGET